MITLLDMRKIKCMTFVLVVESVFFSFTVIITEINENETVAFYQFATLSRLVRMTLNPSVSMFFPHTNVYTWYQTKCLVDVIVSLSFIKLYQTPSGCTGASTFPKKS